ncbi:aspartate kinase [Thermococcus indicus]|uniref:Aspartate kinase n=1 Tax=Thermococcus indicus TaxID=2586643 RepID=A0A4Y5SJ80_9EURY|nr:aspartate kinase [Thermococcus indicus]QDA30846.1 aspartate kinase [Thermococcus indicus]
MIVVKFGGSSVRFELPSAVELTERLWDAGDVVVVVSALKGVTDALLGLARGEERLDRLVGLHREHAERHGVEPSVLSPIFGELEGVLAGREKFPCGEAFTDRVLSFGELLSARIFAEALKRRGLSARIVEPWELLVTDGNFGDASVDLKVSAGNVSLVEEVLDAGEIPVVPGFVGGFNGMVTTLGRGGSDYTASVLGRLLGWRVLIVSHVDGIYTADPHRVVSARLIPFVSRGEALVASRLGMKALHEKAVSAGAEILLAGIRNWNVGTVVGERSSGIPVVVHRVDGESAVISVVGVDSVPGWDARVRWEGGVPYVSLRVPRARLGSYLVRIHDAVTGGLFDVRAFPSRAGGELSVSA